MSSVAELEAEVAATRERLNGTIDQIQDKLTVAGMVDEFMGQAGVPQLESGHDFVLGLLRRHPVPVMIAAAGLGFLIYRMNKKSERQQLLGEEFDTGLEPSRPYKRDRVYLPGDANPT